MTNQEKQLNTLADFFAAMLNEYGERTIDIPTTDPSQFMIWYERSYNCLIHQAARKECLYWAEVIAYWQRTPDTATFICNHDGGARGWIVTHPRTNGRPTLGSIS